MSCTRSYGKSIIELLIHTTSFKKIWRAEKYPRLTIIQLKLIPVSHSTIPFHCSIPLIPDSPCSLHISTRCRFYLGVWIQWNGNSGIVERWNGFFFSSILFACLSCLPLFQAILFFNQNVCFCVVFCCCFFFSIGNKSRHSVDKNLSETFKNLSETFRHILFWCQLHGSIAKW